MKQSVKLLAAVVFCLALAAGLLYWKFDWRIVAFFLATRIPYKAAWLPAIGELGRPMAPLWLLLLWAWAAKRPRVLLAGLLAMLLTMCAVLPIKSAVGRVRPDEEPAEVMRQPFFHRSYSFPSGDATLAFAVATAAAGFIFAAKVRWLPFLLAAMAGVTRLILLRHFASDVIAGAALGILCGLRGAADQPRRFCPKGAFPRAADVLAPRLRTRGAYVSDLRRRQGRAGNEELPADLLAGGRRSC